MGIPVKKEDHIYTYADYRTWPDDERWELIDGIAYDMSPAPNRRHQSIVTFISGELYQYLKDTPCEVYVSPFDVRLFEAPDAADDEIQNVVQPDVSVYCLKDKLDDAGAIAAPDIAVEVLSPYTSLKDQREKLALYERFGVREYWIVDPANETLSVYSYRGKDTKTYGRPELFGPGDIFTSRVLDDFTLNLTDLFTD